MIWNVKFSNSNTFLRAAKKVELKKYDAEGNEIESIPYKGTSIPGTGRYYCPQTRDNEIAIDMTQTELNKLVPDLHVYDEKGEQIMVAPIKNPSAKFWRSIENKFIEYAGQNFDDELEWDQFWLACFRKDPQFNFKKVANEALAGKVKFSVVKTTEVADERYKDTDEVAQAIVILDSMEFNKQVQILKAFGVNVTDPEPSSVKRALQERIIARKDNVTDSGERFIEFFLRLAKTKSEDLNIHGAINEALKRKIITRVINKNMYYYGDIPVGRTKDEVYSFFKEEENKGLVDELFKKTNVNKSE